MTRYARATGVAAAFLLLVPATSSAAGTVERRFAAFATDGTPAAPVRESDRADQCSASLVNSQSSALRCFARSTVRDPCFIDPLDRDRAICIGSPWERSSVELLGIQAAYDGTRNTPSRRVPWALHLRSGAKCSWLSGGTAARGSRRLNYACDDNSLLWGIPNRSTGFWTILRSRTSTGRGWRRAKVAVAWR